MTKLGQLGGNDVGGEQEVALSLYHRLVVAEHVEQLDQCAVLAARRR